MANMMSAYELFNSFSYICKTLKCYCKKNSQNFQKSQEIEIRLHTIASILLIHSNEWKWVDMASFDPNGSSGWRPEYLFLFLQNVPL